ncbi:MAG: chemotaxis protein CheZ [Gammaproteobacteria bacterium SG8_11]|nr:MAG: chemotaxis protein CheZ [Gammaproteobacteria bacterium SG8_11]
MEPAKATEEEVLARAEELIKEMQKGNEQTAAQLLDYVHTAKENLLFQEVGKMTRQLHDALESFRRDSRIDSLAEHEIPDARQRLSYVIEMTQKSADRTLSAVEETMPMAEKISEQAGNLGQTWKKFRNRELSVEQFRELSADIETFLTDIERDSSIMKNNLNDVLMAQDFQDLTGQIIKRVITLVEEVEGNLVELIRLTGDRFAKPVEDNEADTAPEGPHVPGVGVKDVVANQDDVDDLLSSLGF